MEADVYRNSKGRQTRGDERLRQDGEKCAYRALWRFGRVREKSNRRPVK